MVWRKVIGNKNTDGCGSIQQTTDGPFSPINGESHFGLTKLSMWMDFHSRGVNPRGVMDELCEIEPDLLSDVTTMNVSNRLIHSKNLNNIVDLILLH